MTGFARVGRVGAWGELALELRAVNHRFLDLRIVLPEALRPLEAELRARVRARLARGRIDATLYWRPPAGAGVAVDETLAREVAAAARRLAGALGGDVPVARDALSLLAWPGVVEPPQAALATLEPELHALVDEALGALVADRAREGAELAAALGERLERLDALVSAGATRLAGAGEDMRVRLAARLAALGTDVDAARVAQEAALLVVRQDASEELDRLAAHLREGRRLLQADEPVGRRLDFLMQELAREANTLASKAADMEVNRLALECKVIVEEMREQVQNVE